MSDIVILSLVVLGLILLALVFHTHSCKEGLSTTFAVSDAETIFSLLQFEKPISKFARNRIIREILLPEFPVSNMSISDTQFSLRNLLAHYGFKTRAVAVRHENLRVASTDWNWDLVPTPRDDDICKYYSMVYPNSNLEATPRLNFLYACAPKSLKAFYAPFYDPDTSKDYAPVPLYASWRPIWYSQNLFSVNLYPPNKWWIYYDSLKFRSGEKVEGLHIRDDNPLYPVFGYWMYVTTGTGVFYDLGKTLPARSKVHALAMLGLSPARIAQEIGDKHYWKNPNEPDLAVADLARDRFGGSVEQMVVCILNLDEDYDIDRINNSADYDELITTLAKEQGYDSVQFQVQANGLGGWAHEVVFVAPDPLEKIKEVEWKGWNYMRDIMSLEDPDGYKCSKACEPLVTEERSVITCEAQKLGLDCLGGTVVKYGQSAI